MMTGATSIMWEVCLNGFDNRLGVPQLAKEIEIGVAPMEFVLSDVREIHALFDAMAMDVGHLGYLDYVDIHEEAGVWRLTFLVLDDLIGDIRDGAQRIHEVMNSIETFLSKSKVKYAEVEIQLLAGAQAYARAAEIRDRCIK